MHLSLATNLTHVETVQTVAKMRSTTIHTRAECQIIETQINCLKERQICYFYLAEMIKKLSLEGQMLSIL